MVSKQNDQIAKLLSDDSFIRWIKDEATSEEQQKWENWLEEDPANFRYLRKAREVYQSLQFEEEHPDTLMQLQRLEETLNVQKSHQEKVHSLGGLKSYRMQAAAVIVLLLAVLAVIQLTDWNTVQEPTKEEVVTTFETVQTDYGEIKKLTFTDGSEITLNARSRLTYPTTYNGGDMEVELEGEAYFAIDHKSGEQERTFSVKTQEGRIDVLGTRFNVNTYSQNSEIVLEEGKVKVETNNESNASGQSYTMSPNELVRLQHGNHDIKVEKVDTKLFTSWAEQELRFKNTPLKKIAKRIEKIYGVKVEFKEENMKEVEFSGSVPNKNIDVLMEGLRTLLDIPIAVQNENVITFGG